jgi:ribosomal protein S18 acetylase RimI-like enzyme
VRAVIAISEIDIHDDGVAAEIHALSHAAYALEAERIGCADFPPLRETIDELKRAGERFLVFRKEGRMLGALAFGEAPGTVTISRLVVSPADSRRGVATALLQALHRLHPGGVTVAVTTAAANAPAISFYRKLGYVIGGFRASPEGIELIELTNRQS